MIEITSWQTTTSNGPPSSCGEASSAKSATANRSTNVAVREGDWKLLVNADGSDAQLFDLGADMFETKNVAETHPQIAARLTQQALSWRKELP